MFSALPRRNEARRVGVRCFQFRIFELPSNIENNCEYKLRSLWKLSWWGVGSMACHFQDLANPQVTRFRDDFRPEDREQSKKAVSQDSRTSHEQ
jgi:hypothetical protein